MKPTVVEIFQLRAPPFWNRRVLIGMIGVAVLVGLGSGQFQIQGLAEEFAAAVISLGAYLSLAGGLLAFRLLRLPKEAPQIQITDTGLVLPIKADSRRFVSVPFRELRTVELRFAPPDGFLIVESNNRTFLYRVRDFATPMDLPRFGEVLKERLAEQPEGDAILAGLAIESERMRATIVRPTRITNIIAGTLTAVFAIQLSLDAFPAGDYSNFLGLGAGNGGLVKLGDTYRLITANYLHANFLHFGVNLVGLYLLGGLVERVLGAWRFALIYMVSGIAGAAASAFIFPDRISVGASGAIFGVLGAYGVVSLRHHQRLPGGFRVHLNSWLLVLGINAALPLIFPMIDWVAHLGGMLGGAGIALLYTWSPRAVEPTLPTPDSARFSALLVGALYLAGTAAGAVAGFRGDITRLIEATERELLHPELLNAVAWSRCIDPNAGREQLRQARDAAIAAVAVSEDPNHIKDTQAQCLYRLGEFEAAATLEMQVVEASLGQPVTGVYATQLGRFASPLSIADPALLEGTVIESRQDGVALKATARGETRLLWHEVFEGDRAVGMLRICLGPEAVAEESRMPIGAPGKSVIGEPGWPREARLEPRLARAAACEAPESGWSVHYWPPRAEATDLP